MRTVTIAFAVLSPDLGEPIGGDDAAAARLWPLTEVLERPDFLAFDHRRILTDALDTLRLENSP